jgi:hypothetical protein
MRYRLTRLINDVLDVAKMEAGKVEWTWAGEYGGRDQPLCSCNQTACGKQESRVKIAVSETCQLSTLMGIG